MRDSRFNLPIRFPELWGDELPIDPARFLSGDRLWPAELWEALFAVLYRQIERLEPRWTHAFRQTLQQQVLGPCLREAGFNPGTFIARLGRLQVAKPIGRPKSAAKGPIWFLRREFFGALKPLWSRRDGYAPQAFSTIKERWKLAAAFLIDLPYPEFPRDALQRELDANATPAAVAERLVAFATGLSVDTVHAYYRDGQRNFAPRLKQFMELSRVTRTTHA